MSPVATATFDRERLRDFTRRVFERCGVPEDDARTAGDVLALADLRGIDSHGVARLSSYVGLLEAGRINPRPAMRVVRESASTATFDGDNGLGLVVAPRANALAMEKAASAGSGWVAVRNTNHFGIASYYPLAALERDLVGLAMTNSTKLVAPLWGAERMLGTNPLAAAFPGLEEPPIVIDLATSAVAYGKIEMARRAHEPLLAGWAIDAEGRETLDPDAVIAGGALLPLGSDREHGGHKGYALGMLVDLLSALFSGANWGPFTPPFAAQYAAPARSVGKGIGHLMGAWRIDAFVDALEFKRQIDDVVRTFRATKPAAGTSGPLIPGDLERACQRERELGGIPLVLPVVDDLRRIARRTGVSFE